jgi:ABC-2 type transport system permease protein
MSKFWTIFRREYAQVVRKKSFLIGLLLTPALMAAFMFIPAMLAKSEPTHAETIVVVDETGLGAGAKFAEAVKDYKIKSEGSEFPRYDVVRTFTPAPGSPEETHILDSIRGAITGKLLDYALVLHPHAELSDSNSVLITNSSNFVAAERFQKKLSSILAAQRLQFSNLSIPIDSVLKLTRTIDLTQETTTGEKVDTGIKYMVALALVMIMYGMILTYGMQVMRTIIEEKNSRIMEVMISSVSPFELMLGKIFGLGAATLTAVLVWIAIGAGFSIVSGAMAFKMDAGITMVVFNPVVIVFFALFLISGYLMYSTIFALLGSVVNNEKESQSFIMPIVMCMILPVIVGINVIQDPNSVLARVLSFIPLFAPTMMAMRVAFVAPTEAHYSLFSGIVGEATLALLLIFAATVGIIWLTAKIFRVGILMYGKRPTLGELVKWIKY